MFLNNYYLLLKTSPLKGILLFLKCSLRENTIIIFFFYYFRDLSKKKQNLLIMDDFINKFILN